MVAGLTQEENKFESILNSYLKEEIWEIEDSVVQTK